MHTHLCTRTHMHTHTHTHAHTLVHPAQPEGSRGYGYWVCHTLGTLDPKLILNPGGVTLNSIALTGVLQARDCLQKYVGRQRGDACALNFLGLLFEQVRLIKASREDICKVSTSVHQILSYV